jgi:hypothetical protein
VATIHTPVGGSATLVYSPAASGVPHVTLINEGASVVYIGSALVQPGTGLPLAPGQQVTLPFAYQSLYAVSGVVATAVATTLSAAAVNAGATSLTVSSGTNFVNGSVIQVGSGTRAETLVLTSGGGSTTFTVPATDYDHRLSDTVTQMVSTASVVRTESGTG